jgi:hypothetical protein
MRSPTLLEGEGDLWRSCCEVRAGGCLDTAPSTGVHGWRACPHAQPGLPHLGDAIRCVRHLLPCILTSEKYVWGAAVGLGPILRSFGRLGVACALGMLFVAYKHVSYGLPERRCPKLGVIWVLGHAAMHVDRVRPGDSGVEVVVLRDDLLVVL